ncbi:isocitrate lyase/PEP mutase family protein [Novosphingobium capsulatum]|nr:isocitrate lyase/PEP mutase family protein [Novosphingobium capsulatum]WQD95103.1 isocitrate lyase/PEP mutase family protein [Novosphingobium capsulatum]
MADPLLRARLAEGRFFMVPGVQDMIAAVIARKVGFEFVYGTGYWLTASAFGLPDAGIATYTQMRDRMETLVRTSTAAVIADGDTGYGGLINVHHTVRGYEAAGVTAIQLEDQEFPKKCGHMPDKRIVPVEDMVERIKVACAARHSRDFVVIARTDARQSEGEQGVLRRLRAYAEAGADVLFPEALVEEEEMARVCAELPLPCMVNMANGGASPMLEPTLLAKLGFAFAIYPSLTSLAAAQAMETVLRALKDTGAGDPEGLFDFREFSALIGMDEVREFERRCARPSV